MERKATAIWSTEKCRYMLAVVSLIRWIACSQPARTKISIWGSHSLDEMRTFHFKEVRSVSAFFAAAVIVLVPNPDRTMWSTYRVLLDGWRCQSDVSFNPKLRTLFVRLLDRKGAELPFSASFSPPNKHLPDEVLPARFLGGPFSV